MSEMQKKVVVLDLMPKHHDTCADFKHLMLTYKFYTVPVKELFNTAALEALIDMSDLVVVTGAPLDQITLDEVTFKEDFLKLLELLDGKPTLFSCWSALWAYNQRFNTEVEILDEKLLGVFEVWYGNKWKNIKTAVSRWAKIPYTKAGANVILGSKATGVSIATDGPWVFSMDHPEYKPGTLRSQIIRDGGKLPFEGDIISASDMSVARKILADEIERAVNEA